MKQIKNNKWYQKVPNSGKKQLTEIKSKEKEKTQWMYETQQNWGSKGIFTSDGNIWKAMLAGNVDGIGDDTVEGLADHGQISWVLEDLKSGRVYIETILQEEINSHPRKAPEALHPETTPEKPHDWIRVPGSSGAIPLCWDHKSGGSGGGDGGGVGLSAKYWRA